ncbi:MAG: histidine kinase, partial [Bacteroidota bacterium]
MFSFLKTFRGPTLIPAHEKEFREELSYDNLERSKFISFLGALFFLLLVPLNIYRLYTGLYWESFVYPLTTVGHLLLAFTIIPAIMYSLNREAIREKRYPRKGLIIQLTVWAAGLALIWLAVLGIYLRNSLTNFAIFILIINLIYILPRLTFYIINVAAVLVMLVTIYFLQTNDQEYLMINMIEMLGLSMPSFAISIYQYNSRKEQFLSKKKIEDQQVIIEESLKTEFNRKLAEIEMTALRAQMNPHFLFNCLNSIKLYMVQNDASTAASYLTKFSRLIRLILNNSKSTMVRLDKELEALRLYIEMEQFRFNKKFDFNITLDEDINAEFVDIPPLILQPYVENAIWHGIMHKENGQGHLQIDITRLHADDTEQDMLRFVIEDNGIGREKAQALKSRSATRHKSFGMQITRNRIALANELY